MAQSMTSLKRRLKRTPLLADLFGVPGAASRSGDLISLVDLLDLLHSRARPHGPFGFASYRQFCASCVCTNNILVLTLVSSLGSSFPLTKQSILLLLLPLAGTAIQQRP